MDRRSLERNEPVLYTSSLSSYRGRLGVIREISYEPDSQVRRLTLGVQRYLVP